MIPYPDLAKFSGKRSSGSNDREAPLPHIYSKPARTPIGSIISNDGAAAARLGKGVGLYHTELTYS